MVEQAEVTKNEYLRKIHLATGLSLWKGTISEEYLTDWRTWYKASRIIREMVDDSVISAMLSSIKTPLIATSFEVTPANETSEAKGTAEFIEKNLYRIPGQTWRSHVEDALEFIEYGFSLSEKVMEKRPDGRFWLTALVPIGQETLERWGDPDRRGDVTSFTQRDPNKMGLERTAPMTKLLHFVFRGRKKNPMGYSLLRSLYRPWYFKRNLEALEAIGAERDVGNAPILTLGEGYYSEEQIEEFKKTLKGFRMDEALYMILPNGMVLNAYAGGSKVYDIRTMIRDWGHNMRQVFFADFLAMGSESVGTQALASETITFFGLALRSIQMTMVEVWQAQLIDWIVKWNGIDPKLTPKLEWTRPESKNPQALGQGLSTLVASDLLTPDDNIERLIRQEYGLPALTQPRGQRIARSLGQQQPGQQGAEQPGMMQRFKDRLMPKPKDNTF